jgi:hypothetical protein
MSTRSTRKPPQQRRRQREEETERGVADLNEFGDAEAASHGRQ